MPALSVLGGEAKGLMRKLMSLCLAILRSGIPFDANYARTQALSAGLKN